MILFLLWFFSFRDFCLVLCRDQNGLFHDPCRDFSFSSPFRRYCFVLLIVIINLYSEINKDKQGAIFNVKNELFFIISFEWSFRLWRLLSFFRFFGFFCIFWSTSWFCMCFNFRIEQIIDFNFALKSLFRLRKMLSGDDWCPKLKSYEIKNFLNYFLQKFLYNFWVL